MSAELLDQMDCFPTASSTRRVAEQTASFAISKKLTNVLVLKMCFEDVFLQYVAVIVLELGCDSRKTQELVN